MTIGLAPLKENAFTNHKIETLPGDIYYLYSDGYPDQFGELTNKKFKHRNFKKMLESVSVLPMKEQEQRLEETFLDWKGNESQVDDVLIFGFKF
jgi:serine phosphatase RsbU (regulator of sigma subunit)